MTAIILQRSRDPYVCMCCGRLTIGLGVYEPKKTVTAWVCSDPTCIRITRALITMKDNELIAIEQRACETAAGAVVEDVLTAIMGAMWDAGVRSLEDAQPEQIEAALASLQRPMTEQVESALIAFGKAVKADLQDGNCPF